MFKLDELKVGDDGLCWKLIGVKRTETEIKLHWREVVKDYVMNNYATGDFVAFLPTGKTTIPVRFERISKMIDPTKYPMTIKDKIETYKKSEDEMVRNTCRVCF